MAYKQTFKSPNIHFKDSLLGKEVKCAGGGGSDFPAFCHALRWPAPDKHARLRCKH